MAPPSLAVAPPLLRCTRQWWISLLEGRDKGSAWIFMVLVLIYSHLGFFYLVRVIFFFLGGGGGTFLLFWILKNKSVLFLKIFASHLFLYFLFWIIYISFLIFSHILSATKQCGFVCKNCEVWAWSGFFFFFFLPRVLCIFNVSWTCFGMWYWQNVWKKTELLLLSWLALWTKRNEVRRGSKEKSGPELPSFRGIVAAQVVPTVPLYQLESKWEPPLPPFYMINVDGSVFSKQKETGVGVLIQIFRMIQVE